MWHQSSHNTTYSQRQNGLSRSKTMNMNSGIRIQLVAKELNVSWIHLVETLLSKGFDIERKPTLKISEEMYEVLLKQFKKDTSVAELESISTNSNIEPVNSYEDYKSLKITKSIYEELLSKPEWKMRRSQIIDRDKNQCRECKATAFSFGVTLIVHHNYYRDGWLIQYQW